MRKKFLKNNAFSRCFSREKFNLLLIKKFAIKKIFGESYQLIKDNFYTKPFIKTLIR